jgi:hypothetical protein
MNPVFARLAEPSTWAGFAALAAIFAPTIADQVPAALAGAGTIAGTIAGIVAIVRGEHTRSN